jgi:hypothetical protein
LKFLTFDTNRGFLAGFKAQPDLQVMLSDFRLRLRQVESGCAPARPSLIYLVGTLPGVQRQQKATFPDGLSNLDMDLFDHPGLAGAKGQDAPLHINFSGRHHDGR